MLGKKSECYVCGLPYVDRHHIFGGRNRQMSESMDYVVYLCRRHHQEVHNFPNIGLDLALKQTMQTSFEREVGTREQFIKLFGKSYLE